MTAKHGDVVTRRLGATPSLAALVMMATLEMFVVGQTRGREAKEWSATLVEVICRKAFNLSAAGLHPLLLWAILTGGLRTGYVGTLQRRFC